MALSPEVDGFLIRGACLMFVHGPLHEPVGLVEVAGFVFEAGGGCEGGLVLRILRKHLLVVGEGVAGGAGLLEKWGEGEGESGVVRCVAAGDEEFGAGAAEVVPGEEVTREFEADFSSAHGPVALPGAVDGGAVVVDGGLRVFLFCGEAGEAEINEAVAGFGLPEAEEVVVGLFGVAGVAESLGEEEFVVALARARKTTRCGERRWPGRVGRR